MMDKIEFAQVLQFVAITIKGKELSDKELLAYYFALSDEFESIEEFKAFAKKLIKEWKYSYMPKPAHFIEVSFFSDDEIEETAYKAYQLARKTAIDEGCYVSPEFDDPIIADVINNIFGGWFEFHNEVAYLDSDDTWVKKDFIKSYKRKMKNKNIKGTKLVGYLNPKPLKVKCEYRHINTPKNEKSLIESKVDSKMSVFNDKLNNLKEKVRI